jgi:hypothetical protein
MQWIQLSQYDRLWPLHTSDAHLDSTPCYEINSNALDTN